MNKIVSEAIIFAMLFSLPACSSGGKVKISFDTKEYITDSLKMQAQIPEFCGFSDKDFESRLNDEYENTINKWMEDFETESNTEPHPGGVQYQLFITQSVKNNQNYFVSLVTEVYTFTGGAHGATVWIAKNIDGLENKAITLSDLFKEGTNYKEILNKIMLQMMEDDKDKYGDLWEKPSITEKQEKDFYISKGKLVIYYHPYELSYYARGFVEFPISLEKLRPYLKQEYCRLACEK
ncbi:MAG: DUF3298 and DUF4163 domain-containing protein [Clostridia bacterium]|nr:DUF3298 and DUF4163 domain-containing protein [Clostridia bacterium]